MNLLPGSSEAALLELVNQANSLAQPLEVGDLYFGKVKTLSGGLVEIPAVTMYDSAYEGYVKFRYQRLSLAKAFGTIRPQLRDIGYPTLHQLLPVINKKLGINLEPVDVVDVQFDWLGNNEQLNIQITATANSLGYEGSFIVTFTRVRPMLNKVVAATTLDVLKHHTTPVTGTLALAMATYSIDFTDEKNSLPIYAPYRYWANIGATRTLLASYGFPNWPQAQIGTLKWGLTSSFPEANQSFKNVIIHPNPNIAGYTGDAYLHYN
jgi:hypothetical protein